MQKVYTFIVELLKHEDAKIIKNTKYKFSSCYLQNFVSSCLASILSLLNL